MYWGGGGYDPFFDVSQKKITERKSSEVQKGLMRDFLSILEKKLDGGGGVIPKFLVCTQRILLRVSECGGNQRILLRVWRGAYARFFMRTKKLLGRGGGVIPKFLVCTQRILLGGGGVRGAMLTFFMCN